MKFQCVTCKGIVEIKFEDKVVNCGHCNTPCIVPKPMSSTVVIDDFLIEKLLGEGGMGNVYLAHQFTLDRKVALKILKDQLSSNKKFTVDFIKEARSVASLNHPNIIQAFKVGEEDGALFFATEYVEGDTLDAILKKEGVLDESKILEIALKLGAALGYAWEKRQLVHRDIKPENIMIANDGEIKLMDLGLSCNPDDLSKTDEVDTISGTPQYISPEQILGEDIDIRTDFYCLGGTLYYLLSGKFPFSGDLHEMIRKHIQEYPPSLKKKRPDLSDDTVKMIYKLMSKSPDDRYISAKEFIKDISRIQKQLKHPRNKKHFAIKNTPKKVNSGSHGKSPSHQKKSKANSNAVIVTILLSLLVLVAIAVVVIIGKTNEPIQYTSTDNTLQSEKATPIEIAPPLKSKAIAKKLQSEKATPIKKKVIFDKGSKWSFYDKVNAPSSNWKEHNFDDSSWSSGNGEFGFGNDDETTVLDFGGDPENKTISYYFRKTFSLKSVDAEDSLELNLTYDDGAVIYLNGSEIGRVNMKRKDISHSTLASAVVTVNAQEVVKISSKFLITGSNTLAVEVHNRKVSSSDISFDAELKLNK